MDLDYELKVAEEIQSILSSSIDLPSKIGRIQKYYDNGSYVAAGHLAEIYAKLNDQPKAEMYYYDAVQADGKLGNKYINREFSYCWAKNRWNCCCYG